MRDEPPGTGTPLDLSLPSDPTAMRDEPVPGGSILVIAVFTSG